MTNTASWINRSRRLAMTAFLAVLVGLLLSACSPSRTFEAWAVLDDLAAGNQPSYLKRTAPPPSRTALVYSVAGRSYRGDLYEPGDGGTAALVLVPGAAPAGKDDPRLVAVAETLARAQFIVLVPEIPNLRALNIGPEDIRTIADTVRYLADYNTKLGDSVGIVAISYAAGPALLASLAADLQPRVRFVVTIGGYYDIEAVVTFFTTGYYRDRPEAPWRYRTPNAYGKWVFVRSNTARITNARDQALLGAMSDRKLQDLKADISDLAENLGEEGQAVYALLTNKDPVQVPALIAALPEAIRNDMAMLDVKRRDLSKLSASLILIHGRDDAIIPFSESQALADAAPAGRADLYLVDSLSHVDLSPGGIIDNLTLWSAVYRLLRYRDGG